MKIIPFLLLLLLFSGILNAQEKFYNFTQEDNKIDTTFILKKYKLHFVSIDSALFYSVKRNNHFFDDYFQRKKTFTETLNNLNGESDSLFELNEIHKYMSHVKREGNKLKITSITGKEKEFVNKKEDRIKRIYSFRYLQWLDIIPYSKYTFIGLHEDINSYVIMDSGYETRNFILVNKNSGESIIIPAMGNSFQVSPNKEKIFSCSPGMGEIYPNEIELFSVENYKVKKEFEMLFDCDMEFTRSFYGPIDYVWIDDKTIYVRMLHFMINVQPKFDSLKSNRNTESTESYMVLTIE
ncbi:MAG: hypothetical protein Q8880_10970 [Bacteroidota bacterium]|nr:hypothetical protein [Bacteroidota bacterium]